MRCTILQKQAAAARVYAPSRVSRKAARPVSAAHRPVPESHQEIISYDAPDLTTRRQALTAGLAFASFLPSFQAAAYLVETPCADQDTEEDADACRRRVITKDAGKQQSYRDAKSSQGQSSTVQGVPVSVLDDEYTRTTLELTNKIERYCSLDPYSKERIQLVKSLKTDGTNWVSKYARGGSARTLSARRMYIAVDSVVGHLASNGYAPLPSNKVKVVLKNLAEARDYLKDGK